jgi:hypothetical protein
MPSMTTVEGACLMEMREATVVRSGSRNRTIAASNVFSTRPLACTRLIATAVIQCHLLQRVETSPLANGSQSFVDV